MHHDYARTKKWILDAENEDVIEVIAEIAPQTNSMMYSDYFVKTTKDSPFDFVRGILDINSLDRNEQTINVIVSRKDRGDFVSILCNLNNIFIIDWTKGMKGIKRSFKKWKMVL